MKLLPALLPVLCQAAAAQSVLVDFGDPLLPTGSQVEVWNDVHTQNQPGLHDLLDSTGAPSGLQLDFSTGELLGRVQKQGLQVPARGSALEAFGWPVEATSDGLYSGITPDALQARFTLSGLDPAATVDLTFLASELGGTDRLSTEYTATGANGASAVLEPAGNTGELATILGIVPDALGQISVRIASGTTNTTDERDFYLNAMRIEVHPGGTQPPRVAFTTDCIEASRLRSKGPFSGTVDLYTNDLTAPTASIAAVDDATGQAPTWLTVPRSSVPGAPFAVTFDPTGLPLGSYSAKLTAAASGYAGDELAITLQVRDPGALHLLYYGNSWSGGNGGYPDLVELLAVELGYEAPDTVRRFGLGKQMKFHANNAGQLAAISELIPLGEEWDWVLALGSSYEATVSKGDPAKFEAHVLQIVANVRAHSPGARLCLVQPWARAVGHGIYQGASAPFASPLDLHGQIEAGYEQAVASVNALHGAGTAERALTGHAVWLQGFDPALYGPDGAHPGPPITVSAAATTFAALYGDLACRMKLDFQSPAPFAARLASIGLGELDWRAQAGFSDRVAGLGLRHLPGSGDELLLTTGTGGVLDACWFEKLQPGEVLRVRVLSPNGIYDGAPVTIHFDTYPNGSPPAPNPAAPELHFEPQSAWVAAAATGLPSGGLTAKLTIQPWMVGRTLVVQAVAQAPSPGTGRPFTATDAHEVRIGPLSALSAVR